MSKNIPDDFKKICIDFLKDLLHTFPEINDNFKGEMRDFIETNNLSDELVEQIYDHCANVLPQRFFDILYKNEDLFDDNSENCEFLPNIDFRVLWKMEAVSVNTKNNIWKYLQLLLFSITESLKSKESFGDTVKLFEAINEEDLKSKIQETVEQMKDLFETNVEHNEETNTETINMDNLPDPNELHSHLHGLFGGKLGALAQEIAAETTEELNIDEDNVENVGDVFNTLFKNPGKLMQIVNKISTKLDSKLSSGEISQSDLMKETTDILSQMNNMPGMANMEELFKTMNLSSMQKGAAKTRMNNNNRVTSQRERLRKKLDKKRQLALEEAKKNM